MKRDSSTPSTTADDDMSVLVVLRPLIISDLVSPVVAGDGGVNASMIQESSGLVAAVDPWRLMSIGDHVAVYWDDVQVGERSIAGEAELNQRVEFLIPAAAIAPGWVEKVFYRVTPKGASALEDSVPLRIRVKLDLPAGTDREPHLPGHSELLAPVLPQDVIDNGVDKDQAARGVPVQVAAYPGRAAQDTIRLEWGDAQIARIVSPTEAAGTAAVTIDVDQAAILAGGDGPRLRVIYEVFDEVWNYATDWSRETSVRVEAGSQQLRAPFIKEAVNGVIDLGKLQTCNATVEINLGGVPFERDDSVTMTWSGSPPKGPPIDHTQTFVIENIPTVFETTVPNAKVRAILGGRAVASYVLTKADGTAPQSSKRAIARVTGQIGLPAPTIFEAVGDTLDPTLERAHVQIPVYPKMADGDLIDVIWLGTRQDGTPYPPPTAAHIVSNNEVGTVIYVQVSGEHIAPLANGVLDVSYQVSNDEPGLRGIRTSDHLQLSVTRRTAILPAPSVDEAPKAVLDPELFSQATLRVPYTGTSVGDILTWYWRAERPENGESDWVPITTSLTGKHLTFIIGSELILPNINTLVQVFYSLKKANTGQYQYSAIFDLSIGKSVGELSAPGN